VLDTQPLRYIQVGTGGFGAYWCRAFLPRLTELGKAVPVAAVDINPDALKNAQEYLGVPPERCYTDLSRALDENSADFLNIVVPPAFHEAVVDAALARDLHILSEKPIADTMEACCRIYRKVRAAGKKMAVTMSHRFDQDKQSLEAAIKSGDYGPLNYIVHRFTHNCRRFGSWGKFRHEMADPLLVEGSVHHFDILRALCGADAETVYAQSWNPPWGEYAGDSTAFVTIQMTNGVHCLYEGAKANATTMNGWGHDYLRAECEQGTLELDRRKLRVLREGDRGALVAEDLPLLERPAWINAWLAEMFCDWLRGGPAPPNHLGDNIQCAALLFAAVESAHTGRPLHVPSFLQRYQQVASG
jgi:predicted dehydrogenase